MSKLIEDRAVAEACRNWYDLTDKEILDVLESHTKESHE
jgi:HD superfamily phosphohydrolase YqeK